MFLLIAWTGPLLDLCFNSGGTAPSGHTVLSYRKMVQGSTAALDS